MTSRRTPGRRNPLPGSTGRIRAAVFMLMSRRGNPSSLPPINLKPAAAGRASRSPSSRPWSRSMRTEATAWTGLRYGAAAADPISAMSSLTVQRTGAGSVTASTAQLSASFLMRKWTERAMAISKTWSDNIMSAAQRLNPPRAAGGTLRRTGKLQLLLQ